MNQSMIEQLKDEERGLIEWFLTRSNPHRLHRNGMGKWQYTEYDLEDNLHAGYIVGDNPKEVIVRAMEKFKEKI